MKFEFSKMSATANDFIFVERAVFPEDEESRRSLVRRICDRHRGVGADGMIAMERDGEGARWAFYNSDGSPAEMCGNAARCAAIYALEKWGRKGPFNLVTKAGNVELSVISKKLAQVLMPGKRKKAAVAHVHTEFGPIHGKKINTGVPHFVIEVPDVQRYEHMSDLAVLVREDRQFQPDGTNVTFVKRGSGQVEAVTFERGVDDFTQACGTGAVAAALVMAGEEPWTEDEVVEVVMPGGTLEVGWDAGSDRMTLLGEAGLVFEGEFSI